MMNNYFYGKSGKGDYRVEDMPANRFQLFFAVWKVRWSAMVGVNLLHIIFWLPAAIWTIMNFSLLLSGESETLASGLQSFITMYCIGLIPCLTITGPFNAGTAYVMRNWARDEHSFVWSDFWDAVKGNWKQGLLVSLISSTMPLILYVGWQFYSSMAQSNVVFTLPMCLVFLVFFMWKLSEMIMYPLMVTYQLSFKNLLRNSFLLTMAKLPLAVGVKLLTLVFPVIALAVMLLFPGTELYVILIFLVLYAVYVPVLNRLIVASYSNALCEKYLNTKIEGARSNIGLRPEDWDDTEYLPEDDE